MKKSFRLQLFFIMIVFAIVIAFTIAFINQKRMTEQLIKNNQFQIEQIEETVKYSLETIDKVYYYFDEDTTLNMRMNMNSLMDLYEENNSFKEWDFQRLKESMGMDIYIINKDNIITHSSLKRDIGMDFDVCCSTLASTLEDRRKTGEFYHDGIDIDQGSGEITKYSYMATKDQKYIIELGYKLQSGMIFNEFNFLKVINELETKYPSIDEINVINIGGIPLGEEKQKGLSADRRQAFNNTLHTGVPSEIEGTWNNKNRTYRYVTYTSKYDEGLTKNKVIEIVYNEHQLESVLQENQKTFLIQLLLISVVTVILALILSKLVAKPMYMAFHDSLTGLKNRAAFEERLSKELKKSKENTALLMFDLDNFKLINDQLGHDQGDQLLKLIADTVKSSLSGDITAYRLGGDEFALIIPSATNEKSVKIASRILQDLKETFYSQQSLNGLDVTASMGIAITSSDSMEDIESLYRKADRAMYNSKVEGKNQFSFYNNDRNEETNEYWRTIN